jgi:hypothetical protein
MKSAVDCPEEKALFTSFWRASIENVIVKFLLKS